MKTIRACCRRRLSWYNRSNSKLAIGHSTCLWQALNPLNQAFSPLGSIITELPLLALPRLRPHLSPLFNPLLSPMLDPMLSLLLSPPLLPLLLLPLLLLPLLPPPLLLL